MIDRFVIPLFAFAACARSSAPDPAQPIETVAAAEPAPVVAAPPPKPATDPPTRPSPFAIVATRTSSPGIGLHTLEDGELVASAGPLLVQLASDGTASFDASSMRGIAAPTPQSHGVEMYGLEWIDPVVGGSAERGYYLVFETSSGFRSDDIPRAFYVKRPGQTWRSVASRARRFDAYPVAFGAWKDGSLLALRAFDPRYDRPERADETWEPSAAVMRATTKAIAQQKRLVVVRGTPRAPALSDDGIVTLASLGSGEIVAYAAREGQPRAIHLDATGTRRELPLPAAADALLQVHGVIATAPERMWMFGGVGEGDRERGWLARFDGTAWSLQDAPICTGPIRVLAVGRSDGLHAICNADRDRSDELLWARTPNGEWAHVELEGRPEHVAVRGDDDLWVTVEIADGWRLLHRGPSVGEPLELPDTLDVARLAWEWAEPRPFAGDCTFAFLPLTATETRDDEALRTALTPEELQLDTPDVYFDVVEARVQGERRRGLRIAGLGDFDRGVARLRRTLGKGAGTPTCNYRPGPEREGMTE